MIKALLISLFVLLGTSVVSAQNSYDGDSLHKYILKQVNSAEVDGLVKHYALIDQDITGFGKGKMNKERNVVMLSTVEGVTRINLYGYDPLTNENGKKVFPYKLPLGVSWGMNEEEVKKKLEGMTINLSHRYIQIYYKPGVNFEYYFGTQNGKLQMISVIVSWSKFDKGAVVYAIERVPGKIVNPPAQPREPATTKLVSPNDFCGALKSLLAEAVQKFSSRKKIKQLTANSWQAENTVPAALFTVVDEKDQYSGSKQYVCKITMNEKLQQGPEANRALGELKNKITACLAGYIIEEFVTSRYSDNPDDVAGYSWKKGFDQPFVELKRDVDAYNKAGIFLIIKSK